jgi:hypothetical protein
VSFHWTDPREATALPSSASYKTRQESVNTTIVHTYLVAIITFNVRRQRAVEGEVGVTSPIHPSFVNQCHHPAGVLQESCSYPAKLIPPIGVHWCHDKILIILNLYHKLILGQFDQQQALIIRLATHIRRRRYQIISPNESA